MVATATLNTWAIQGEDSPAHAARIVASILATEGVVDVAGDSFKVAQDTGSNMQIKVGSGTAGDLAAVAGDLTAQGLYVTEHQDATVTLAVAASDPTNDRIDRVILRIYDDDEDSSGNSYADIEVIQGTPAASPSAPALPSHAITLATILVQATVTAITNSDITDGRTEAKARGQYVDTVYFTSSGTFDKADYPWLKKVVVKVQAGGGGSGGTQATSGSQAALSGGGGGGGYAETEIHVEDLATSETVTVGAGGAGGASGNNAGSSGGSSSFGAHAVAAGGEGGVAGAAGTTVPDTKQPQSGGAVSAGDLQIPGGASMLGMLISIAATTNGTSAAGGDSMLGAGGRGGRRVSDSGVAGTGFGSGAAGQITNASSSATAGTTGQPGIVIVELYA